MRDISGKTLSRRTALAQATLRASAAMIQRVKSGDLPKGDPLPVAKIAAIQAVKSTSLLIPYCHPLPIDFVDVRFELLETEIRATVRVTVNYKTGVEMEALTGASLAALTIYDMLKFLDEEMEIVNVRLIEKKGGKSDFKSAYAIKLRAAVVVVSDSVAQAKATDSSGALLLERLREHGLDLGPVVVVSDEPAEIEEVLCDLSDRQHYDLIVTTGGTGLGPRDNCPEVTAKLIDKEIPGVMEAARAYGQQKLPYSMLSRGKAGMRGSSLIVNFPGSKGGVSDYMDALFPGLLHSFHVAGGGGHPRVHEMS